MIKALIHRLFFSNKKQGELLENLKKNPDFRTKEEIEKGAMSSEQISDVALVKGELTSISVPCFEGQKDLILTKWHCKSGDIVKKGAIICDLENENIAMEFETFYSGKILLTSQLNAKLTAGEEIFKIEGI